MCALGACRRVWGGGWKKRRSLKGNVGRLVFSPAAGPKWAFACGPSSRTDDVIKTQPPPRSGPSKETGLVRCLTYWHDSTQTFTSSATDMSMLAVHGWRIASEWWPLGCFRTECTFQCPPDGRQPFHWSTKWHFSLQLLAIICMACASPAYRPGSSWFLFVVVTCFIITLTWVFVYLLGLIQNVKIGISWLSLVTLQLLATIGPFICIGRWFMTGIGLQRGRYSPILHCLRRPIVRVELFRQNIQNWFWIFQELQPRCRCKYLLSDTLAWSARFTIHFVSTVFRIVQYCGLRRRHILALQRETSPAEITGETSLPF